MKSKLHDIKVGDKLGECTFMVRCPERETNSSGVMGKFLCFCGKEFITRMRSVQNGTTKSCGCFHRKVTSKLAKSYNRGDVLGDCIFLEYAGVNKFRSRLAIFECKCGNKFTTTITAVKTGSTKSCGCSHNEAAERSKIKYEEGQKVGNLIYLSDAGKSSGSRLANFLCVCGNIFTTRIETAKNLITKSCGCLTSQLVSQAGMKHGHAIRGAKSITYNSWQAMWSRCTNPNNERYPRYLELGITVCEEWKSFDVFLSDMGERPSELHTIDRIKNKKGYFKENCRWATKEVQQRNRENTVFAEYNGERKPLAEWAEITGIDLKLLYNRIVYLKWDVGRAFNYTY